MKNFIIALLVGFSQLVSAQNVTIDLSRFATKQYVDSVFRSGGSVPSIPELDACQAGPRIEEIYNITTTGAKVRFHGVGVYGMDFGVYNSSGTRVSFGVLTPTSNVVSIVYAGLSTGTYTLKLSGNTCKGEDSKQFTISLSGGVVIPYPGQPGSPGQTGSIYAPASVAKGMDEDMKLTFQNVGDHRLVSDISAPNISSNYNFWYMVGPTIIKGQLKNYQIAGNNPLRIWKMKIRNDIQTTNQWHDKENTYYYSTTAGEPFKYNTSVAFQTFVFRGPQDSEGFLNHIPQSYNPETKNVQWGDIAPDMRLPAGHFWISNPKPWGVDYGFKKGITHISKYNLPWNDADGNKEAIKLRDAGLTYNDVPRTEHIFNLPASGPDKYVNGYNLKYWPNGPFTEEQAIQKANEADISDAIWIGETEEGESFMPNDQAMWGHFYRRLRERYEERFGKRGIPYLICHNYFRLGGAERSLHGNSRESAKKLLRSSAEEIPVSVHSPGRSLSSTNLIVDAVYLNAPDITQGSVYEQIYQFHISHILGYKAGTILFGVHEWRPNNKYEVPYDDGKFYKDDKIPLDPNVHIAHGFVAQVFGEIYLEWGGPTKIIGPSGFDPEWTNGVWFPTGATSPQPNFPHFKKPGEQPQYLYTGSTDLSYFSQKLYNDSFGQVNGGDRKYLRHRIDNGSWITPSSFSADEIVDSFNDKRGFVFSETKAGKSAWFYLNSYADNSWHTLDVELPNGRVIQKKVAGNGIHARLETL